MVIGAAAAEYPVVSATGIFISFYLFLFNCSCL
jgi:hypothetical protein